MSRKTGAKKTFLVLALVVISLTVVYFAVKALLLAQRADACAAALVEHAQKKDEPYLRNAIGSPKIRERILNAEKVESLFVRPSGGDRGRIGLHLQDTATSAPSLLVLSAELDDPNGCRFILDYGQGAFQDEH